MWISLLHHVCNQNEWLGEIPLDERELPWFDRRDKDFEALQAVILEPTLLESFEYYTGFMYNVLISYRNNYLQFQNFL